MSINYLLKKYHVLHAMKDFLCLPLSKYDHYVIEGRSEEMYKAQYHYQNVASIRNRYFPFTVNGDPEPSIRALSHAEYHVLGCDIQTLPEYIDSRNFYEPDHRIKPISYYRNNDRKEYGDIEYDD